MNSPKKEAALALAFYLIALGLAFGPKWAAGYSFLTEAIWDPSPHYLQYPADVGAIESFRAGQFCVWDPTRGFGTQNFVPVSGTFANLFKTFAYLFDSPAGWEAYLFLRLLAAGFFAYLLARSLPVRFSAALLAGTAYMLCGYFRIFINFQHVNAEAQLPLLLFSFVILVRRPGLRRFLLTLFLLLQQWCGGNPTTFCYVFLYAGGFWLWLAAEQAAGSRSAAQFIRLAALYLACWAGSFLWAAYAFAGAEYAAQVAGLRLPGLAALGVPLTNAVALVTPVFDYWLPPLPAGGDSRLAVLNFIPGYLGLMVSALALVAVVHLRRAPRIGLFFIFALPFTLGLVFSIPPFNLLGRLPVLDQSQNFRYSQSLLALSAALAAGIGLHLWLEQKAARLVLAAAFGAALAVAVYHGWFFRAWFRTSPLTNPLLGGMALAAAAIAATYWLSRRWRPGAGWGPAILVAALAELLLYFHIATPLYRPGAFAPRRPAAADWLAGRPGVFRILGLEPNTFHPNLAGLWGLEDVRDSTPIYLRRYQQFAAAAGGLKTPEELLAHYFKDGRFFLDFDAERMPRRLLDLMNVRYLVSAEGWGFEPFPQRPEDLTILSPTQGAVPIRFELNVEAKAGKAAVFTAAQRSLPTDPDGIWMTATETNAPVLRLARYFPPGSAAAVPAAISLDPGRHALAFASLPGPRDGRAGRGGNWEHAGLLAVFPPPGIRPVDRQDYAVYENTAALNRAFWTTEIACFESDDQLTARLTDPQFEPARTALVHGRGPCPKLPGAPGPALVELTEHQWGTATVKVQAEGAGMLVLSDLYYSGWEARVDGIKTRIWPVDLAFRGVAMAAGEHEVVFRYAPPMIHLALWPILVSWAIALLLLVFARRREPKPTPH